MLDSPVNDPTVERETASVSIEGLSWQQRDVFWLWRTLMHDACLTYSVSDTWVQMLGRPERWRHVLSQVLRPCLLRLVVGTAVAMKTAA